MTNTQTSDHTDQTTPLARRRGSWRVVDIVVAAVLGIACGLLFFFWNTPGYAWWEAANALTPGLGGIANGGWLVAAVIGGLVIRKPGAAVLVEVIASVVSTGLGSQWGMGTLWIGLLQGLGAELVFAALLYRRFGPIIAILAGLGAGIGSWLYSFLTGDIAKTVTYNIVYATSSALSGAVIAGLGGWLLVRALASTGVLSRFGAGRQAHRIEARSTATRSSSQDERR